MLLHLAVLKQVRHQQPDCMAVSSPAFAVGGVQSRRSVLCSASSNLVLVPVAVRCWELDGGDLLQEADQV